MRALLPALVILSLLAPGLAEARTNKVRHDNLVPPAWAATAAPAVGQLTDLEVLDGVVYLAGSDGIAAVEPGGAVRWTLPLPPAAFRNLDVDAAGIAFTAVSVAGVEPASGFRAFALGSLGDVPAFKDAAIGLLSLDGKLAWQVPSDIQSPLSAPGLSPTAVAVMRGKDMIIVDRADGHTLGVADIKYVGEDSKFFAGFFAVGHRGQPVWHEGAFYSSFYGYLVKADATGGGRETALGPLFHPFYDVTTDPVPFSGMLLAANTIDPEKGNTYFAVDAKLDTRFNEATPDKSSGTGAIAVVGDRAYLASNFYVWAIDAKGREKWCSMNKKGGLTPSSGRGIRYLSGMGGVGFRKSASDLMVADTEQVYIATNNAGDVITVLDAATGAYVRTIDVKEPLVALGLTDKALVVATDHDVRFLPTGG